MTNENLTIQEILQMGVEERKNSRFNATQNGNIEVVKIDGNEFTDYGAFSFLWEKSYVKSPERSGDGTIGNLNSHATFVTPHLKIDFSMMSIDSYRRLMELVYSKNEFLVECYDIVHNKVTQNKMYFATEEMPKLWTIARALNGEQWIELLGVQEYTVEMIGTNASIDTVEVLYYDENGNLIAEATQEVRKGTEVIINYNFVAPSGKRFDGVWSTKINGQGTRYANGSVVSMIDNLSLYPVLVDTNQYTLTLNYGNGETPISKENKPITSVRVNRNQSIGTSFAFANIPMPNGGIFSFPTNGTGGKVVQYDGQDYTPYEFKGWYWVDKVASGQEVTADTRYDKDFDRIVYQVYEPKSYYLSYNSMSSSITFYGKMAKYGDNVSLPTITTPEGKQISGWYLDKDFKKPFDGIMPPKSTTIYAKWG